MSYEKAKAAVFADGYHVGFWGDHEPCRFALLGERIYAVHDSGTLWTGMVANDEREARWTIENSSLGRVWGIV